MAGGGTQERPEGDRHNYTKDYLLGQISILMGGRIAEESFLGGITTRASNDLQKATEVARSMVCQYGMCPFGPLTLGQKGEQILQCPAIPHPRHYSQQSPIRD